MAVNWVTVLPVHHERMLRILSYQPRPEKLRYPDNFFSNRKYIFSSAVSSYRTAKIIIQPLSFRIYGILLPRLLWTCKALCLGSASTSRLLKGRKYFGRLRKKNRFLAQQVCVLKEYPVVQVSSFYRTPQSSCLPSLTWGRRQIRFPKRFLVLFLE
jgi:hypothetical protein